LGLEHFGVVLGFCDRPVITEQSIARWRSILMLGSSPGGMGTGSLQRGQSGATRLYLASSYFAQLCEAGLKCSEQKEFAQCWHLKGKKSTRWHVGCEHWRPTFNICSSRAGPELAAEEDAMVSGKRYNDRERQRVYGI